MATRTGARPTGRSAGSGGRIAAGRGRANRPRFGRAKKTSSGPMGMVSRVAETIGRTGGRAARGGGGMAGKAVGFVQGFLSGGQKKRGRRRR